jgi:hypothetical protein
MLLVIQNIYRFYGGLMVRKKSPNTKNQTPKAQDTTLQSKTDREDKIINSMVNTTVILMSTMMGAFTQVIVNATGAMASGMAQAMGGIEAQDKVNQEIKQKLPEVDEKMKAMISDLRKDVYFQMEHKKRELEPLLSDPVFEVGPKIIEKYDFKLPKLTQKLDDNTLAQYSQLLVGQDLRFAKMFKELTKWINSLPKPHKASQQKTEITATGMQAKEKKTHD